MEGNTSSILFPYDPEKFWMELRKIVKEEVQNASGGLVPETEREAFLPRVEVAKMLRVSLVTLNDWVKRGLPAHKHRGKVYFLYSEVENYIKLKN